MLSLLYKSVLFSIKGKYVNKNYKKYFSRWINCLIKKMYSFYIRGETGKYKVENRQNVLSKRCIWSTFSKRCIWSLSSVFQYFINHFIFFPSSSSSSMSICCSYEIKSTKLPVCQVHSCFLRYNIFDYQISAFWLAYIKRSHHFGIDLLFLWAQPNPKNIQFSQLWSWICFPIVSDQTHIKSFKSWI